MTLRISFLQGDDVRTLVVSGLPNKDEYVWVAHRTGNRTCPQCKGVPKVVVDGVGYDCASCGGDGTHPQGGSVFTPLRVKVIGHAFSGQFYDITPASNPHMNCVGVMMQDDEDRSHVRHVHIDGMGGHIGVPAMYVTEEECAAYCKTLH